MSLRSRLAGALSELRGNPLENPSVPIGQAAWLLDWGGGASAAGVAVNEKTAMQLATVYSCVNVLASDFASLPCRVFQRTDKGLEPAEQHPLNALLSLHPNINMTAVTFWGALAASAVLRGNGYAIIQRDNTTPIALWPIHPDLVKPRLNDRSEIEYRVTVHGKLTVYASRDMFHVPALTMDGLVGIDPISALRQSIGTAIAAGKHVGGFFGRGSRPSGILKRVTLPTPAGTLPTKSPESSDALRESWERGNAGDNQGRTAVLPAGYDWVPVEITPEQSGFLEIMQHTRTEIAGLFRVPPHMVGDTSRLSNSNHESQSLEYVKFTLLPWIRRFEEEIRRKLLPSTGQSAGKLEVKFDVRELERGDFASQMAGFASGRQWGYLNADEIREDLGLNPIGGPAGTQYAMPLNMIPADNLGAEPEPLPGDGGDGPAPAGNGGRNQRMLLDRMAQAFGPLFRDAAGRLNARDKRDDAAVQQTFSAVLQAIADESGRQARELHRLDLHADLGTDRIVRDALKAIEKRAAGWTASTLDAEAAQELDRTVRSITLQIFREAGAQLAQVA